MPAPIQHLSKHKTQQKGKSLSYNTNNAISEISSNMNQVDYMEVLLQELQSGSKKPLVVTINQTSRDYEPMRQSVVLKSQHVTRLSVPVYDRASRRR
jgi:hypothetical protein